MDSFKPIRKQKASDLIVVEIWGMILAGKLKPGDHLPPEHTLVERFQVSKVTLREALQTLETYGHIIRKHGPGGGSIVLDIAPTMGISLIANYLNLTKLSLGELMEVRKLIEPLIAETAAFRLTEQGAARIGLHLKEMENGHPARAESKHGCEFPILLAELTGNRLLKVVEELLMHLFDEEATGYCAELEQTNRQVAEAVLSRDPSRARASMIDAISSIAWSVSRSESSDASPVEKNQA